MKLRVKVVGCGGIGLCLLNVLPRYLSYLKDYDSQLTLIDGDNYEDHNSSRQAFSRYGNKAEVTAEIIRRDFPNLFCWTTTDYLTEANICMLLREGDVIFSCVDNHATRKLISERCEQLENVVLISGGNEYEDGNIQVHIRKNGVNITKPIANEYHPEIVNPKDKTPDEAARAAMSCESQRENLPQLLITNNSIAALMLNAFYGWLQNAFESPTRYDEVYTDIKVNATRPVSRR